MTKVDTREDGRGADRAGSKLSRWTRWGAVAAVAVAAVTLVQAQPHGGPHGREGGPMGMMMFGGPPERAAAMADRMLDGLNATESQRTQIRQIVIAAATDLRAGRDAGRELRQRGLQILTAPTVDAGAAESLRQQMLAEDDKSSRRVMQATLDIARVLTPEQRAQIAQRLGQRQAIMRDRAARMEQRHPHAPPPPPPRSTP